MPWRQGSAAVDLVLGLEIDAGVEVGEQRHARGPSHQDIEAVAGLGYFQVAAPDRGDVVDRGAPIEGGLHVAQGAAADVGRTGNVVDDALDRPVLDVRWQELEAHDGK